MPELRCDFKVHAVVIDEHTVEVKCSSSFCGARPGTTVLHRFDTRTGELIETLKFKSPQKGRANAPRNSTAVRAS